MPGGRRYPAGYTSLWCRGLVCHPSSPCTVPEYAHGIGSNMWTEELKLYDVQLLGKLV